MLLVEQFVAAAAGQYPVVDRAGHTYQFEHPPQATCVVLGLPARPSPEARGAFGLAIRSGVGLRPGGQGTVAQVGGGASLERRRRTIVA